MRVLLLCMGLLGIASTWTFGAGASEASPRVHHDLLLRLDPASGVLEVRDRIQFLRPPPAGADAFAFTLNAGLEPSLDTSGAPLTVIGTGNVPVPFKRYAVAADSASDGLTLRYRGRLAQRPPAARPATGNRPGFSTGHVGPQGVFLTGASHWYPRFGNALMSFSLTVRLPGGWTAVSQGERDGPGTDRVDGVANWREAQPQDDIVVVANRFETYTRDTPAAEAMVFLRRPDPAIAERYLAATGRYLDLYERLIGPYPYAKFALVENFWETGYGMPSFTVLGPRVLRFPFIIDSSYPHEILHSWWGNAVYVDHARGNWSEGLTAYLADHLVQESRGRGSDYRRAALEKYRNYVDREHDFALRRFRAKHGTASEAVGYNKTLMFFHMLRLRLGDRVFIDSLRHFYAAQRFRVVSYPEMQASFEIVSGRDLGFAFDQWVDRVGAPGLQLLDVRVEPADGAYRLRGRLEQTQAGAAYRLLVPLAVALEDRQTAERRSLEMNGKSLDFDLSFSAEPTRLAVDPEFDLFRRLDLAESPPALGELFGADKALFVLPADAPGVLVNAYRALAERLGGRESVRDADLARLPADRPIWLLGWENEHLSVVARALADQGVDFEGAGVRIDESTRPRERECVVLAARRSDAARRAVGWIGCDTPRAFQGLARKLPHYGKYGFLGFSGDAPRNVLKGQWRVVHSPLDVQLSRTAAPGPLKLTPGPTLIEALERP